MVSSFSGGSFVAVSGSANGLVGSVFESSFNAVTNFTTSGAYSRMPRVTTLSNRNYFVLLDGAEGQINGQLFNSSEKIRSRDLKSKRSSEHYKTTGTS